MLIAAIYKPKSAAISKEKSVRQTNIANGLENLCFSNQAQIGYKIKLMSNAKLKGMNNDLPKYSITNVKKLYWRIRSNWSFLYIPDVM